MYYKQYFAVSKPLSAASGLEIHRFGGLYFYHDSTLCVTEAAGPGCELICLGYLIDPFAPEADDRAILSEIARSSPTLDQLFLNLSSISGRYVILYRNRDQFVALSDPFAQRQLYASVAAEPRVLTSNPKMLLDLCGLSLCCSREKVAFVTRPEFRKNESAWLGDTCLDDRLRKVLPNHYVDLISNRIRRIPFCRLGRMKDEETLDFSSRILTGSLRAVAHRFFCLQPLTGGWDSRVLLAAARNVRDRIQFYVFDNSRDERPSHDVRVAAALGDSLGLDLQVWRASSLRDDFRRLLQGEQMFHQSLLKSEHIQFLFDRFRDRPAVRISGIGGETARCFYGFTSGQVSCRMLQCFAHYPESAFAAHAISDWRTEVLEVAAHLNVSLLDLFYWEQRLGNWASVYSAEQDVAVEEFCPFGNRALILALLLVPAQQRCPPRYRFFLRLIESLWPEAAREIPGEHQGWVTVMLRRRAKIRYHKMQLFEHVTRAFGLGRQARGKEMMDDGLAAMPVSQETTRIEALE